MKPRSRLAAITLAAFVPLAAFSAASHAQGIPVIDIANLIQIGRAHV